MITFQSIELFRHVIMNVKRVAQYTGRDKNDDPMYDDTLPLPTLQYTGTVKLDGTNGGVSYKSDGTLQPQSRGRELVLGNDNRGFAKFVHTDVPRDVWSKVIDTNAILLPGEEGSPVTIFGEWCGPGIGGKVALKKMPHKAFIIFAVLVGDRNDEAHRWASLETVSSQEEYHILSIMDFPTKDIEIDFNKPQESFEKMEAWVDLIDKSCPVGKQLGVDGNGEGLVFTCTTPGYISTNMNFKVKGASHKVSGAKEAKKVSPDVLDRRSFVKEVVEALVTEGRLNQGIEVLKEGNKEPAIQHLASFINWVLGDILKEEYDVLNEHEITKKEINFPAATKAREWFKKYLDDLAGL